MKRKTLINTLYVGWIASLLIATFAVLGYIHNKTNRLHSEIRNNIESIFEGQSDGDPIITDNDGFFDVQYSGHKVKHYKRIAIPSKPSKLPNTPDNELYGKFDEQLKEQWQESYGDLSSLYALNWGDEYPNNYDDGWTIVRICCCGSDDEFIQTNVFFPYQVGLKRTEWGNYYTVEDAVADAYEFYTTNEKSGFADRFQKGSINRIWSRIYDCCNEYFCIVKNENASSWKAGIPIVKNVKNLSYEEIQRKYPYENGWMHNGFYRVFIAASQETKYKIEKIEWAISDDRNSLLLWWGLGISIVFLGCIIPLTIIQRKSNKRKKESLHERLCRLCSPEQFVANYDKEKLDAANEISKCLMQIDPKDKEELASLANRAISELEISIIDENELVEMREKANPSNYIKPYDPDKVSIANEAYSLLEKERLTYEEYIRVKSLLEKL